MPPPATTKNHHGQEIRKKIIPKKFEFKHNSSYRHISKKYRKSRFDAFYTSDISPPSTEHKANHNQIRANKKWAKIFKILTSLLEIQIF